MLSLSNYAAYFLLLFYIPFHRLISFAITYIFILQQTPQRIEINSEDEAIDKMLQFLPKTEENPEDTVKILFENVAELKEYYGINKEQEKKAFYSTIIAGFCGLGLFFVGTIIFLISGNNQIVIVTSIASAIIEIVSCLFMKLLKNTLKQMKEYHTGLEEKEMYLIALKIAELLPEEKRNEQYEKIIEKILEKK